MVLSKDGEAVGKDWSRLESDLGAANSCSGTKAMGLWDTAERLGYKMLCCLSETLNKGKKVNLSKKYFLRHRVRKTSITVWYERCSTEHFKSLKFKMPIA